MAKVGRPSSYRPEFCERVIELGKEGKGPAEIASALDVDRTTMLGWARDHEEFQTALTRAKTEEQAWWENTGRNALNAQRFQPQVWVKSMQARFRHDYTERLEQSGPDGAPLLKEPDPADVAKVLLGMLNQAGRAKE